MSYRDNRFLPHPSRWDWEFIGPFLFIGLVILGLAIAIWITTVVGDHQQQDLERHCHAIPHTLVITGDTDLCIGIKDGTPIQLFHD